MPQDVETKTDILATSFQPVKNSLFLGGVGGGGVVLKPFQDYFTYYKQIVNQRWVKTATVSGEKPPDLLLQNLASPMWSVPQMLGVR